MHLELKRPYLSIEEMREFDLPDFAVLIGRNGVGKTQLLDAITNGSVAVSGLPRSRIEKYDISSFQPKDAGKAGWSDSSFPQQTVVQYFLPISGPALVEVAKNIFQRILKDFALEHNTEGRRNFEDTLRMKISKLQDFQVLGNIGGNDAVSAYSQAIQQDVIGKLTSGNRRSSQEGSFGNNPAALVSHAMKVSGKLPHELCQNDVLRAAHYEGDTIGNQLSRIFTRYKLEQYSWAHTEGETSEKSFQSLMAEYHEAECPPWVVLRANLERMREASDDPELFNFEFSDPEGDRLTHINHQQYSFEARFTNRSTGKSYSVESLSSGEKILLSLCLASFNRDMGQRQLGLLLLDELDAMLHPSMISALIAGLKDQFISNGTRVVMATHSVTTVSMLEEDEIYRVAREGSRVDVRPVRKAEAVSELSEGLATIDTGLRIAATESTAPVTILTEGYNTLHLSKWASLFFPNKVDVFDELPDKTGASQLLAYGRLLAKMNPSSHVLIVWDCDSEGEAKKLSSELTVHAKVTPFSFTKRDNRIASKGIENKFDEALLNDYSNTTSDNATGKEIDRSMSSSNKKEFARHVFLHGTTDFFEHFDDLKNAVQKILRQLEED